MRNVKCDKQMVDLIIIHFVRVRVKKESAQMCSDRNWRLPHSKALKNSSLLTRKFAFFFLNLVTASHVFADCDSWVAVGIAEAVHVLWRAVPISNASKCTLSAPRLMCNVYTYRYVCEWKKIKVKTTIFSRWVHFMLRQLPMEGIPSWFLIYQIEFW